MQLYVCNAEATFEYFEATRGYVEKYGSGKACLQVPLNHDRACGRYSAKLGVKA